MKKKNIVLAAIAIVLVLSVSMGSAWAYFTTRATAAGALTVEVGFTTTIEEPEFSNWTKHMVITNNEDSKQDVFIRARAYSPSQYPVTYSGEGWVDGGDGWWYYTAPVAPGDAAAELLAKINNVPDTAQEGASFNVTVVHEATPVTYNAAGEASYTDADWDFALSEEPTR